MDTKNQQLQKAVNDKRYTISLEFIGKEDAKLVSRFCGELLESSDTLNDAILVCIIHQGDRLGIN